MIIVDIICILALVGAFATGITRGLFASLGTIVGLVIGAATALWAVPLATPAVSELVPIGGWRTAALAALALGIVLLCTLIGSSIGAFLRRGIERTPLRVVDRVLGAALNTLATGLALLLVASGLSVAGIPGVSPAVASSRVLSVLDALTPAPVDDALAGVRGAFVADALPRLEAVIDTIVVPTGPVIALDDPDLQAASASVARISGTAYACGVSMTGSGFVAAADLVVTNAHVVAGVDKPVVELPSGASAEGRLVYFDPIDDLAVIAVAGLDAEPLAITDPVPAGTQAAIQGYPHGGPFRNSTAAVLAVGPVPVPDIYDGPTSLRDIYALRADVQPGNSGGPLLSGDGEVIGVVFARGVDDEQRGYAITTDELRPVLALVTAQSGTVASGRCTL